jgi:hypothetical protein
MLSTLLDGSIPTSSTKSSPTFQRLTDSGSKPKTAQNGVRLDLELVEEQTLP